MKLPKTAVITGASTGIGYAAAEAFIKKGCRVFGSVRKQADADRLKAALGDAFTPLIFDVTDTDGIILGRKIVEQELKGSGLGCLVNNAGIVVAGPLQHIPIKELRKQFEVNVIGLIEVTQQFLPLLGAKENHPVKPGKIINISSVAGKMAVPFLGPYAGSKHAVEGVSHSLRRELQVYGIDVVIVGPGAVKTPIWDKAKELPSYEGTVYSEALDKVQRFAAKSGENGYPPEYLGEKIVEIFFDPKPKVRYAYVPQKWERWIIPRLLPARMFDRMLGKRLGLLK
jgi:short-subunit dehydrogenase